MKYIATLLGSAALAAAHGYVDTAVIGGETYTFYQPYQDPYSSPKPDRISRRIEGNGPVEDLDSIDLQCGGYSAGGIEGSEPAALHAKVAAGEEVTLYWTLWPESHVGPSLTYMARCPDTGCQDWLPENEAVWFKIQEEGRDGTSNNWGTTTELMSEPNDGVKYTIPECLEPGYYLVRHELIALHASYQYPGAQFYPGCHQLEVTGSGTTSPSDLVSFPGAYSADDPGITYDAYAATEYTIPGPALFTCGGATESPNKGNQEDAKSSGSGPTASSVESAAPEASTPASENVTAVTDLPTSAGSSLEDLPTSVPEPEFTTLTAAPQPSDDAADDDQYEEVPIDEEEDDVCEDEDEDIDEPEEDDECEIEDDEDFEDDIEDDECEIEDDEDFEDDIEDDECEIEDEDPEFEDPTYEEEPQSTKESSSPESPAETQTPGTGNGGNNETPSKPGNGDNSSNETPSQSQESASPETPAETQTPGSGSDGSYDEGSSTPSEPGNGGETPVESQESASPETPVETQTPGSGNGGSNETPPKPGNGSDGSYDEGSSTPSKPGNGNDGSSNETPNQSQESASPETPSETGTASTPGNGADEEVDDDECDVEDEEDLEDEIEDDECEIEEEEEVDDEIDLGDDECELDEEDLVDDEDEVDYGSNETPIEESASPEVPQESEVPSTPGDGAEDEDEDECEPEEVDDGSNQTPSESASPEVPVESEVPSQESVSPEVPTETGPVDDSYEEVPAPEKTTEAASPQPTESAPVDDSYEEVEEDQQYVE